MNEAKPLILCEHFLSVEGEGDWIGYPVTLIRFSGCNLRCSYCDTKFSSWYTDDKYSKSKEDVLAFIEKQGTKLVSMTGGEPMWREAPGEMEAFLELCKDLCDGGFEIKVETNGLIFDERFLPYIRLWSVSPKLQGMGDNRGQAITYFKPEVLSQFIAECDPDRIQLKFVVGCRDKNNTLDADLADIKKIIEDNVLIRETQIPIILQPEGLTQDLNAYAKRLAQLCEHVVLNDPNGWWAGLNIRILPQMHRIAWNNERLK